MSFVGGDILEVSFKHPVLGNGTFEPKSAEDCTIDLGGWKANDDDNSITGNGTMIDQINRKRWSAELTVAWDSQITNEVDLLNQLAESPVQADWIITHINGTIWGGKGKPVGDIKGDTQKAIVKFKLAGGGKLKLL
jgi:hypothetical protein